MSSQTQQYVEELVAMSPWVAFFVAVCWSRLLDFRDDQRSSAGGRETAKQEAVKLGR